MERIKTERSKSIIAIAVFFAIAVAGRYITVKTDVLTYVPGVFLQSILQAIGPAIGAWIAFRILGRKSPLTFNGNFGSRLLPVLVFWIIPTLAFGALSFCLTGKFSISAFILLVYALLEEIGWRGFLQPTLSFMPRFTRILAVTVFWFIWHLNFDLTTSNLIFFLVLLAGSWGIGAVADKTRSLFAVSAFHAIYDIYSNTDAIPGHPIWTSVIFCTCITLWLVYVLFYKRCSPRNLAGVTADANKMACNP